MFKIVGRFLHTRYHLNVPVSFCFCEQAAPPPPGRTRVEMVGIGDYEIIIQNSRIMSHFRAEVLFLTAVPGHISSPPPMTNSKLLSPPKQTHFTHFLNFLKCHRPHDEALGQH